MAQRVTDRKGMDITLEKVDVPILADRYGKSSSHLVGLDVIWPRMSIALRSGAQGCRIEDGACSLEKAPWGRRILVREIIEGRFAVRATLSEALEGEELEKLLRGCGGVFFGLAADFVEGAAPVAGKLAAAPFDYAARQVAKYPGPEIDAEGMADLAAWDLPGPGGSLELDVTLFAARDFVRTMRRTVGKQTRTVKKTLLGKGEPVGSVGLKVDIL